ncbi:hypothetical protein GOV09_00625 [Candidatus Woesearchaeota archaeon]|nr:hypothetical protein [Candidatus Woesearchaeota archaeon]
MKKYFLILLLCCSFAYAEMTFDEVFNGEVKNYEDFTADDKTFSVIAFDTERARISYPSGRDEIINVGECESDDEYRVCLLVIRIGNDDEFDIAKQEYPLFPKLSVEKPSEDIGLERTFQKTEFFAGERARVEIVLTNTGTSPVDKANYYEEISDSVELTDINGLKLEGKKLTWEGTLPINIKREFSYIFEAKENTTFTSEGYLVWGIETLTDKQEIIIEEPPLSLTTNITQKRLDIGEESLILISFENKHDEFDIINIRYAISFPDGLKKIAKTGKSEEIGSAYVHEGSLAQGESRNITFTLLAMEIGNYTINEEVMYTLQTGSPRPPERFSRSYDIEVATEPLKVNFEKIAHVPGQDITLPLFILNQNKKQDFKNVLVKIKSDLFEDKQFLFTDFFSGSTDSVDIPIRVPEMPGTYEIEATVTYDTKYGESLKNVQTYTITIDAPTGFIDPPIQETGETPLEQTEEQQPTIVEKIEEQIENNSLPTYTYFIVVAFTIMSLLALFMLKRKKSKSIEDKLKKIE